ncbi:hypothetical protein OfM1_19570 [Lactovum odontotermitis]
MRKTRHQARKNALFHHHSRKHPRSSIKKYKSPLYAASALLLAIGNFLPLNFMPMFSPAPVEAEATTTQQTDEKGINWNMVAAGNALTSLISSAAAGSTLYIKASTDLTIGTRVTIPANVTLVLDMDGHALYTTNNALIRINTGNKITFQNENMVATGTSNRTTVPNPSGSGTTQGDYNYYYGLFSSADWGNTTGASLTYKNVTQNLSSITSNGDSGEPFYNQGIPVYFSGTNYFFHNSGQEFMEGEGIIVLDGTTTIVQHTNQAVIWGRYNSVIKVAAGATLRISGDTTTNSSRGFFYMDNKPSLNITNNGTLIIDMQMAKAATDFYSGTSLSSITMNFGENSTTNITGYGLFSLSQVGSFSATIGSGATFDYNTANGSKVFAGTKTTDSFTINSAKHVRFSTDKTATTGSILGTEPEAMAFRLNAAAPASYAINGYNRTGALTITASATTGAYGVTGTFHSSLKDLSSLKGIRPATASDIKAYQDSAQLEFNLISPAQATFTYAWAEDVPGQNHVPGKLLGALPDSVKETGNIGEAISPPDLTAPTGYVISGYRAPNGTVYPTLGEAIAQTGGGKYPQATNDFQVILSAQTQTFYVDYGYEFDKFGNLPPFPPAPFTQTGLTGAPIVLIPFNNPPDGYHYSGVRNKNRYFWVDAINPETGAANTPGPYYNHMFTALQNAIIDENGGLFFGTTSLAAPPVINEQGDYDNNIMLLLSANAETANYTYSWASNTPGYNGNPGSIQGTLPGKTSSKGGFGDRIAADSEGANSPGNNYASFVKPPDDTAHTGYYENVLAPNGITYTSDPNAVQSQTFVKTSTPLAAATQANTFLDGASANNFSISYTPVSNKVTWHYQHDSEMTSPPADIVQDVLTGAPLTNPNATIPEGYRVDSYHYPGDPVSYTSLEALQIAHNSGANDITITVVLAKNFVLPFTGGSGSVGIAAAAGLSVGAALLIRQRKKRS